MILNCRISSSIHFIQDLLRIPLFSMDSLSLIGEYLMLLCIVAVT